MLMIYLSVLDTEKDKIMFESIYNEHKRAAMQAAMHVSGGNIMLSEDAVHDAFLSIVKNWGKFVCYTCNKWRSLIVIITKHKTIDLLRKEKGNVPLEDDNELLDQGESMEVLLQCKEDSTYIAHYVENMPEIYKIPLQLRYYHDFTIDEIATITGITPNNVSVRLHRGMTLLCKNIRKERLNYGEK
jgi:RNA polymerase sigma-70 factor (ECF subfamily)